MKWVTYDVRSFNENSTWYRSLYRTAVTCFREMIASLKICAAVHGTVDDNMAVHAVAHDGSGDQEGQRKSGVNVGLYSPAFILTCPPVLASQP